MSGIGSSIDSIFVCASRRPVIKLDIDRFGVGRLSLSSAGPPSELLEVFFLKPFGDEADRSFSPIALDVLLTADCGRGDDGLRGEVAG